MKKIGRPKKGKYVNCIICNKKVYRYQSNIRKKKYYLCSLKCRGEYNRLYKELAAKFTGTADLEDGYFPAPHMVESVVQDGVDYPNCTKMIFDAPKEWEWHPYLTWSEEEREMIKELMGKLPPNRKNILLETFAGSGQSNYWDEATTKKIMTTCRAKLGVCNFIFCSHKHKGGVDNIGLKNDIFFDDEGCVSCANFTVRQTALVNDYCDLMICMSSGISVATSAWGLKPVPKLQYCGSKKCSTVALANGTIELVTTDFKIKPDADAEFFSKLDEMLKNI